MGSRFQRRDRGLFADRSRYNDEGQVLTAGLQNFKRGDSVEPGHGVVGNHHVPITPLQGSRHLLGGLHPFIRHVIAATDQIPHQEFSIVCGIFDDENPEGLRDNAGGR